MSELVCGADSLSSFEPHDPNTHHACGMALAVGGALGGALGVAVGVAVSVALSGRGEHRQRAEQREERREPGDQRDQREQFERADAPHEPREHRVQGEADEQALLWSRWVVRAQRLAFKRRAWSALGTLLGEVRRAGERIDAAPRRR